MVAFAGGALMCDLVAEWSDEDEDELEDEEVEELELDGILTCKLSCC